MPKTSGTNYNPASVAITGGTISNVTLGGSTNAEVIVAKWAIPFVVAPTGTMANNGAITLGTALDTTYSDGIWLYLPAGAVAAGVPAAAGWLWCVMSSSTVGAVYNSTYTSGTPTAGTTTAFSTTGPGAYTGVTTQISGPTITIPGGTFGANGQLRIVNHLAATNNADTKIIGVVYNATDFDTNTFASVALGRHETFIMNRGATGNQEGYTQQFASGSIVTSAFTAGAVDSTASQTLTIKYTRGTATDKLTHMSGAIYAIQ